MAKEKTPVCHVQWGNSPVQHPSFQHDCGLDALHDGKCRCAHCGATKKANE